MEESIQLNQEDYLRAFLKYRYSIRPNQLVIVLENEGQLIKIEDVGRIISEAQKQAYRQGVSDGCNVKKFSNFKDYEQKEIDEDFKNWFIANIRKL